MTLHYCSDGTRVSEASIGWRLTESHNRMMADNPHPHCGGCDDEPNDFDHTIAKARCKEIHHTELIWDDDNQVFSCRRCHREWEAYKSGLWIGHKNMEQRLRYLKDHDPEGYQKRIEFTKLALSNG